MGAWISKMLGLGQKVFRKLQVWTFESFSPLIKPATIHVVFTLAVTCGWDIKQVDINNAFLNGELQETPMYLTQYKYIQDLLIKTKMDQANLSVLQCV